MSTDSYKMDGGNAAAADDLAKELEAKAVVHDAGDGAAAPTSFTLQQTCAVIEDWFALRDGLVGVDLSKKGAPGNYGVARGQRTTSGGAYGYGRTGDARVRERGALIQTKFDMVGGSLVSNGDDVTDSIQADGDAGLKFRGELGTQGVWYLVKEHWEERFSWNSHQSKCAPAGVDEDAYEEYHLVNAELICAVINYYMNDASVAPVSSASGDKHKTYEPVFATWGKSVESRAMCIACDVVARVLHGVDHKENEKIDRLLVLGDTNAARRAVWDKITRYAVPWHGEKPLQVVLSTVGAKRSDTVAFMQKITNPRKEQYNRMLANQKRLNIQGKNRTFTGAAVDAVELMPQKAVNPDPHNAEGVPDAVWDEQVVFQLDLPPARLEEERILALYYGAVCVRGALSAEDRKVLDSWPEFNENLHLKRAKGTIGVELLPAVQTGFNTDITYEEFVFCRTAVASCS